MKFKLKENFLFIETANISSDGLIRFTLSEDSNLVNLLTSLFDSDISRIVNNPRSENFKQIFLRELSLSVIYSQFLVLLISNNYKIIINFKIKIDLAIRKAIGDSLYRIFMYDVKFVRDNSR